VLLKLGENERKFVNEDRTSSVANFMVFQLNHDLSTVVGGMHKGGSGERAKIDTIHVGELFSRAGGVFSPCSTMYSRFIMDKVISD
jgi:hypothetical protein